MKRCLFALCAVLGLACGSTSSSDGGTGGGAGGGGGSGGGGGADAGRIADVCGTICTKLDQCEPSDGGSNCAGSCQTLVAPFRDEYTQALAACIRDTACADQIETWNTCADGGLDLDGGTDGGVHSCSGGSTNVCLTRAGDNLSAAILEPFYTAVCPQLITCGTVTDDAACRALLGGLSSEPALKAYPDSAISCTASCLQAKACTDLSSANLELSLDDCAAKSCGIHLNK